MPCAKKERRDRLHKKYLRRNASGKQQEYENKVKAAKKVAIETRKMALRAEDMTKGVFFPISVLSKVESQKLVPARTSTAKSREKNHPGCS